MSQWDALYRDKTWNKIQCQYDADPAHILVFTVTVMSFEMEKKKKDI